MGTSRRRVWLVVASVLVGVPLLAGPAGAAQLDGEPGIEASPDTAWTASVAATLPPGTVRVQVLRDGRLIDDLEAEGGLAYTDHLLWPGATYQYEVRALDANGGVLSSMTTAVTTPSPAGSFPRLYDDASFWNTQVGPSPALDPSSAAMVAASLVAYRSVATVNNDDTWGMPVAYSAPTDEVQPIACLLFNCETPVSFRMPSYARPNLGSDGHLAVIDPSTGQELDLWKGAVDPETGAWSAGGRSATDIGWGAACGQGQHCGGGGVAAGFNEFGGVIRPEEIAQGHIDHALVISMPYVRADFIACPATNPWAPMNPQYVDDPNALPLGAHVQLDPAIKVAKKRWPSWLKVVARALQTYGAYVGDVSSTLELRGEANLNRRVRCLGEGGDEHEPPPQPEEPAMGPVPGAVHPALLIGRFPDRPREPAARGLSGFWRGGRVPGNATGSRAVITSGDMAPVVFACLNTYTRPSPCRLPRGLLRAPYSHRGDRFA